MSDTKKIVIMITCGLDDERSSVAWSVANGAIASDMQVTVFLAAGGVDHVRKGAADQANPNPLDPTIGEMIGNVVNHGGRILACPPCAKVRGYDESSFIEGVTLAGSPAMHEVIKQGAATLCF